MKNLLIMLVVVFVLGCSAHADQLTNEHVDDGVVTINQDFNVENYLNKGMSSKATSSYWQYRWDFRVFVGNHGDDKNSGKSSRDPFRSLQRAFEEINAPWREGRVAQIVVLGKGYTGYMVTKEDRELGMRMTTNRIVVLCSWNNEPLRCYPAEAPISKWDDGSGFTVEKGVLIVENLWFDKIGIGSFVEKGAIIAFYRCKFGREGDSILGGNEIKQAGQLMVGGTGRSYVVDNLFEVFVVRDHGYDPALRVWGDGGNSSYIRVRGNTFHFPNILDVVEMSTNGSQINPMVVGVMLYGTGIQFRNNIFVSEGLATQLLMGIGIVTDYHSVDSGKPEWNNDFSELGGIPLLQLSY